MAAIDNDTVVHGYTISITIGTTKACYNCSNKRSAWQRVQLVQSMHTPQLSIANQYS